MLSADPEGPFGIEMHQVRHFLALRETLNFTRAVETYYVVTFSVWPSQWSRRENLVLSWLHRSEVLAQRY